MSVHISINIYKVYTYTNIHKYTHTSNLLYFHNFQEPTGKKRKTSRFSKNEKPPDVESQGPGSEFFFHNDRNDSANGDHVDVYSSRVLTTPQVIVRYVLILHINMFIHLCINTKV